MTADPAIRAIAALDDDLRWRMYEYIRAARRPVTRDEAAAAVGISRKLAAFHLDKLVDAGALRAHYRPAETVRRVGRSPKVYEPSGADIRVSIPQRSHDMLAGILLDAVISEDRGENARAAAQRVAREHGEQIGVAERDRAKPGRLGAERALTLAGKLLSERGFEPDRESATCLRLRNCPFHPLTARAPELVCGLNHAFISGMVDGLQASTVTAVLDPRAGECCVELRGVLRGRQDVDVEFVAFGVCHAAPLEALELAGVSRLKPAAAEVLYLRRRLVEVVHDKVKVHPVLA